MTPAQQRAWAIVQRCAQPGDDLPLVMGVIEHESSFDPDAFAIDRNGGSYGLMQLDMMTARDRGYRGEPHGLLDPDLNVSLGMAQLRWIKTFLARNSALSVQAIAAAYNEGVGNVLRGNPDPRYVGAVLAARTRWQIALDGAPT